MELKAKGIMKKFPRMRDGANYFYALHETDFSIDSGTLAVITGRSGGDGLLVLVREAPLAGALLATREEKLKPQADTQEGNATAQRVKDGLALARLVHVPHGALEAPHAGKHQARSRRNVSGRVGDNRLPAHGSKAVLHREEVSLVVVDDDDLGRCHQSAPFVDGMPSTRGSGSTAALSARANDLNVASRMWCAFSPAISRR